MTEALAIGGLVVLAASAVVYVVSASSLWKLVRAAKAAGADGEPVAAEPGGEPVAAEPGATGRNRATLNGQVDDAALDGLAGGAAAGGGEGEP